MSAAEKPHIRHRLGHPKGGLMLIDEGNIIPEAAKDIMSKVANKLLKMEFSDLLKQSAPAFLHTNHTYMELAALDCGYASKYLNRAADTKDPIERLKLVICMYVGGHHISPEIT